MGDCRGDGVGDARVIGGLSRATGVGVRGEDRALSARSDFSGLPLTFSLMPPQPPTVGYAREVVRMDLSCGFDLYGNHNVRFTAYYVPPSRLRRFSGAASNRSFWETAYLSTTFYSPH